METHTERLARIRSQLSADDGQGRGSGGRTDAHPAVDEAADDASASDSDAEEDRPALRDRVDSISLQRETAVDEKPRTAKKKGKRKRDMERKRPGKRQRAELRHQLIAAGVPQRIKKRAAVHASEVKGDRKQVKSAEGPADGQQMQVIAPAVKPKRNSK